MSDLSPAAEAVFDALNMSELNGPQQYMALAHAAAALRAAADQLGESRAPGAEFEDLYPRIIEVPDLLAIADELEAQ